MLVATTLVQCWYVDFNNVDEGLRGKGGGGKRLIFAICQAVKV